MVERYNTRNFGWNTWTWSAIRFLDDSIERPCKSTTWSQTNSHECYSKCWTILCILWYVNINGFDSGDCILTSESYFIIFWHGNKNTLVQIDWNVSPVKRLELFSGNCPMLNIPGCTYPVKEYLLEDVIEIIG